MNVKLGTDVEQADAIFCAKPDAIEAARIVLDEPLGEERWKARVRNVLLKAIEKTEGRKP